MTSATLPRAEPFLNVASYLPAMAAAQPDELAVAVARGRNGSGKVDYDRLTARELNQACDRASHALAKAGIGPGSRTVLMVKPSPEFFAVTFALFKLGAVVVMVDPGMGVKNLGQCLDEAEPDAFIGIPKAHVARLILRWMRGRSPHLVTVGRRLFWGGDTLSALEAGGPAEPYPVFEPEPDTVAAILFTSGSTGVPKGAIYRHRTFAAQVAMLKEVYGIEPGERDLSTFPLFALFGPALGMAAVVPDMDASRPATADPRNLVDGIRDFECTNMFASPALVDKIGRHCESEGISLPSLRRAISAGAPASVSSLKRFAPRLSDGVEIFTPYGATESLPVANLGSATIIGETAAITDRGGGVCVGHPVAGMEVRIIGISDEAIEAFADDLCLPPGETGEIVVKGPVVTDSYYGRPESTRLAKMRDPDGSIRHRMGDVGYLDDEGRLWMCGRKSHRVETAGGTMFTIPCEGVFNTHPQVFRSALVGVKRSGSLEPVICIELEKGQRESAKLTEELRAIGKGHDHTRSIQTVLYHRSFPVDVRHNAKIFREKLAVWAAGKVG